MAINDPFSELVHELDRTRGALRAAVDAVEPELRKRKPAPEAWSVAEVLEHLGIVERRITQLLTRFIAQAREARMPEPNVPESIVHSIDMATVRDRSRKVASSEVHLLPIRGLEATTAWLELETARRALLAVIADAQRIDLSSTRYPHFILGPLNGYQWLAFVAGHEARHTAQIEEIASRVSHCV